MSKTNKVSRTEIHHSSISYTQTTTEEFSALVNTLTNAAHLSNQAKDIARALLERVRMLEARNKELEPLAVLGKLLKELLPSTPGVDIQKTEKKSDTWIPIKETAKIIGVSPSMVYFLAKQKKVITRRDSAGRRTFNRDSAMTLAKKRSMTK